MGRWRHWIRPAAAAVVAVLLVKALVADSCFIPSSGMENSLYKGEGVLVSKWSYGLRLPLPSLTGCRRLSPRPVKRGDIVVYNDPSDSSPRLEARRWFISRCTGLPGDTLMLNSEMAGVGGRTMSPDSKALYAYPPDKEGVVTELLEELGIDGNTLVSYTADGRYVRSFSHYELYLLAQRADGRVAFTPLNEIIGGAAPFVVPSRGGAVTVQPWNAVLLCNTINLHERGGASLHGDTLYVGGQAVEAYTFSQDYYWMSSNDPVNLCDSRLFGFVPETHIVGKAWRIWLPQTPCRFWQRVK